MPDFIDSWLRRQIRVGAMSFNIDTPRLEQIVLIVLAIVALVAAVAWLSHRRRQRSRTRWITDKYKQMVPLSRVQPTTNVAVALVQEQRCFDTRHEDE